MAARRRNSLQQSTSEQPEFVGSGFFDQKTEAGALLDVLHACHGIKTRGLKPVLTIFQRAKSTDQARQEKLHPRWWGGGLWLDRPAYFPSQDSA